MHEKTKDMVLLCVVLGLSLCDSLRLPVQSRIGAQFFFSVVLSTGRAGVY